MIIYSEENRHIVKRLGGSTLSIPENTVWIDLPNPTREEETAVEEFLCMEIPTREEMHEIEVSNRLYQEHGAQFMTATIVTKNELGEWESHAVTFVIADRILVTIRYSEPLAFASYAAQVERLPAGEHNGATLLLGLLDEIVNSIADVLEFMGRDIDTITRRVFNSKKKTEKTQVNYQKVLEAIGRSGDLASKAHESLITLGRLAAYASHNKKMTQEANDLLLVALRKDITGLVDHGNYLTGRVNFLLDATLGMISIEQNTVFRVLSVASLVFLPPTLVAGIYGMNFKLMPELEWHWGYPSALLVMVFAAILPYAYLKQRKLL